MHAHKHTLTHVLVPAGLCAMPLVLDRRPPKSVVVRFVVVVVVVYDVRTYTVRAHSHNHIFNSDKI